MVFSFQLMPSIVYIGKIILKRTPLFEKGECYLFEMKFKFDTPFKSTTVDASLIREKGKRPLQHIKL